ncbi:MAG TPA: PilZ domain-containing protein [Polyangia bacterium]|nr:PilZ domain-containing protein [Polyangia bacterium]
MTGPVSRDARKQVRAVLELPVVVSDPSNPVRDGIRFEDADVSTGGAFLRTDLLFEVGARLTLQFQLPHGGPGVRAAGRVSRVSRGQSREVAGMGVEFVDLRPEDRAAIEERLRR